MKAEAFQALLDQVATTLGPLKGPLGIIGGVVGATGAAFFGAFKKRRELANPTPINDVRLPPSTRMADEDRSMFRRLEDHICENTREMKDLGAVIERAAEDVVRASRGGRRRP